jgi:hypothetical protein
MAGEAAPADEHSRARERASEDVLGLTVVGMGAVAVRRRGRLVVASRAVAWTARD